MPLQNYTVLGVYIFRAGHHNISGPLMKVLSKAVTSQFKTALRQEGKSSYMRKNNVVAGTTFANQLRMMECDASTEAFQS